MAEFVSEIAKEKARVMEFLSDEFCPMLEELGFGELSPSQLPEYMVNEAHAYLKMLQPGSQAPETFGRWLSRKYPAAARDLWLRLPLDEVYLAEVPPEDRLAAVAYDDHVDLLKFSLRVEREPVENFMSLEAYKALLSKTTPEIYSDLSAQEVETIRRGAVLYFEDMFADIDNSEAENLLDLLFQFRDYFTDTEFNDRVQLDSKMTRSLQEVLWFLQELGVETSDTSEFTQSSLEVADQYLGRKRAHLAKHQNNQDDDERASFFEHFTAVARFALGFAHSLKKNSAFMSSPFLNSLEARPHFWLELAYTSLLHDAIEDDEFTQERIREMLEAAELEPELIDNILTNLHLLNSNRTNELGEKIGIEQYTQAILQSDNPVVQLVKFSDIIHNNKSVIPKAKFQDSDKSKVSEKWRRKQTAYADIVEFMNQHLLHIRVQDPSTVFDCHPELIAFDAWQDLIRQHPQPERLFEAFTDPVRSKVEPLFQEL